jgi:galactose oxidase
MANLGNAWHIPDNPEPRGRAGMRDPVGAIVPGTAVTIFSGNQFQGSGNPGNQLQNGSSIFFKRKTDAVWTPLPPATTSTIR